MLAEVEQSMPAQKTYEVLVTPEEALLYYVKS
jgi:hypothetical protein